MRRAGRYIADFLAPSARLIIEVDGARATHRAWRKPIAGHVATRVPRPTVGHVFSTAPNRYPPPHTEVPPSSLAMWPPPARPTVGRKLVEAFADQLARFQEFVVRDTPDMSVLLPSSEVHEFIVAENAGARCAYRRGAATAIRERPAAADQRLPMLERPVGRTRASSAGLIDGTRRLPQRVPPLRRIFTTSAGVAERALHMSRSRIFPTGALG